MILCWDYIGTETHVKFSELLYSISKSMCAHSQRKKQCTYLPALVKANRETYAPHYMFVEYVAIFLMYRWTGDRDPIIISDLLDVPMDWRQRPNHCFRSS